MTHTYQAGTTEESDSAVEMTSGDMIYITKSHGDQFRHSSNIKGNIQAAP
jgi:hypothetical protein